MQLEEGTIDEETFAEIEADVFARIRELKGDEAGGGIADASAFDEIEVEIGDDERELSTSTSYGAVEGRPPALPRLRDARGRRAARADRLDAAASP